MQLVRIQLAYPERAIAKHNGDKTYFTGRPCKQGHTSPRNTVDASCIACRQIQRVERRPQMASYMRNKRKEMLERDPEGTRARWQDEQRLERERFPERVRERERKYSALKRKLHPQRKNAETRKRQAAQLQRTPKWADLKSIRDFYVNCPPDMEVDHILPLRGKTVCGFHVLNNLQYISPLDNKFKGNRMEAAWAPPEMSNSFWEL